jgi:hypothetical protein
MSEQAGDSVPINQASDEEVMNALRVAIFTPLEEAWKKAAETTRQLVAAKSGKVSKEQLESELGVVWKDVWYKFDSLEYVVGHLKTRVTKLRAKGIVEGDPREAEILKVNPL